jgi:hypothetical protein
MARSYSFCVVQFPAHPLREERLNLAIAIFHETVLEVRPARRLDKLKALSAALDLEAVRDSVCRLSDLDSFNRSNGAVSIAERHCQLASFTSFQLSPLGSFVAPDSEAYERRLEDLLKSLVEPEPAPATTANKRPTKLLRALKKALRSERILAKKGEGLEAHRIVSNHRIDEGLTADLLLKNGAFHVIETVDAVIDDAPLRRMIADVAVSALVFERARMTFGENQTHSQLVYRASSNLENIIAPSLQAAEHQGAQLLNWESLDDQRKLLTHLASLAEPFEKGGARERVSVHASTQRKLSLN